MDRLPLRKTWLVRGHEILVLLIVYAAFTAAWFCVGWLLVHPLAGSTIAHMDRFISEWFVRQRTPGLNSLTAVGSFLADTTMKVIVTFIVALVMLWRWKRWLEPLMVVIPLILEALCFITVTVLVGRPRPNVVRLDGSPVGSSYPSGHMAAAVAYAAIIVVVFWHTRRVWIRVIAVVAGVGIATAVGLSRMYRGMHYPTDVLFGGLLGGASVVATVIVLRRASERQHSIVPQFVVPSAAAAHDPKLVGVAHQ
jgi:undecaprenyl-diphosphatase